MRLLAAEAQVGPYNAERFILMGKLEGSGVYQQGSAFLVMCWGWFDVRQSKVFSP